MSGGRRRSVVLLGMMTRMPVPGVLWQTLHYLLGFSRLGYEVRYVEAHARAPMAFLKGPEDSGSRAAARFLAGLLERLGLGGRWAYHALHHDGACWGADPGTLRRWYRSADLIVNLHGGTRPLDEHTATGRLVLVATDPVRMEIELWQGRRETHELLEAHSAVFTFGENYGRPGCPLPVSDRFELLPTRQPVVTDLWESDAAPGRSWRTVANWRQRGRQIRYRNEVYHWSKDLEFEKVLDLPRRSGSRFELALSNATAEDHARLTAHGWVVLPAGAFATELDPYREFVRGARGELTVAKDQNVRLRTGWFSDRSATFLASGRPVVTQDTGFGDNLPTGEGLFAFSGIDGALAALERVETDPARASRAARDVARGFFDHRVVLPRLLAEAGVEGPRAGHGAAAGVPAATPPLPADLVLEPVSRRPLRLPEGTVRWILERPLPRGTSAAPPLEPWREGPAPGREEGGDAQAAERPAVSIVVVTWNGLPLTRLCFESLLAHTSHPRWEVVVVDNASSDGSAEWLQELAAGHACVRLLLNAENQGFARACNQGAQVALGQHIVFLNNDTVLAPGWLEGLLAHLADPSVGAVGPLTNRSGTEADLGCSPRTLGDFLSLAGRRREAETGAAREVEMLALFCLALRRGVWEEVGPLDEGFGLGLFEDDDLSWRLRRAGYRLLCAEDVLVHHFGEASFGELVPGGEHGRLFQRNKARFESKWRTAWVRPGSGPDQRYRRLVGRVREAVAQRVPAGARVAVVSRGDRELLDLGSAAGLHFPMAEDGGWAGHYPADGREALEALATVRRAGADHLLVPEPAFWWLDHYHELGRHLCEHGEEIMRNDDLRLYRLAEPAREPQEEPAPVFIIGAPRSGTSVLTWALGQHPNLYPLEETVWFGRFHRGLDQAFQIGASRGERSQLSGMGITREAFFRAFGRTADALILAHREWPSAPVGHAQAFARARAPDEPKRRWVDGTPENSFFVTALVELFPRARFIHLLRDGASVVRSLLGFHNIGGARHTPTEAWEKWIRHVRACLEAESMLGPGRIVRVLHRDLVDDPETAVRACLVIAGEPFRPECLLPLSQRINSSGSEPVAAGAGEPPDASVLAGARELEERLFGSEALL